MACPPMLLPLSASPLLTSSQESVFQEQCEGLMEEESEGEEGQDRPQKKEDPQAAPHQAVSPLFTATAAGEKKTERQRKKEKADKRSVSWASPRRLWEGNPSCTASVSRRDRLHSPWFPAYSGLPAKVVAPAGFQVSRQSLQEGERPQREKMSRPCNNSGFSCCFSCKRAIWALDSITVG